MSRAMAQTDGDLLMTTPVFSPLVYGSRQTRAHEAHSFTPSWAENLDCLLQRLDVLGDAMAPALAATDWTIHVD